MITPWRQTDASPTGPVRRYQWTSQSAYGFLNPDIALLKAFSVNAAGLASCTRSGQGPPPRPGQPAPPPECKDSATAGQVRNFANDNTAFMNAIGPVLTKMIEKGTASFLVRVNAAVAPRARGAMRVGLGDLAE